MKKNIAVVCGGFSGESVISLRSASFVMDNLNADKFQAFKIIIEPQSWYYELNGEHFPIDKNDFSILIAGEKIHFDLVYLIIHGDPGENGRLQAYFEMLQIPCTSSSSTVSALTFNKAYCNYVVQSLEVNVSPSVHLI